MLECRSRCRASTGRPATAGARRGVGWRNRADRRGMSPEMGGAFNVAMSKDIASEAPWQAGRHRGSQAGHRSKSAAEGRRGPKPHAAGRLDLGGSSLQCLTSESCQRGAKSSPHVRRPAPCKVRQLSPMGLRRALVRAHLRKKGLQSSLAFAKKKSQWRFFSRAGQTEILGTPNNPPGRGYLGSLFTWG